MFNSIFFRKNRIDFIVAGVQKAGTTALDLYLRKHDEIGMGKIKEIHFFDNEKYFNNKKIDYREYHNNFDFTLGKKVYGEVTPIYSWWKDSIKRISNYNKKIKLIIILRNPIDRAFSNWNMEVSRNNENRDFYTCISENKPDGIQNRITSYKERGFYYNQVNELFNYFDKSQLMFVKYEDFLREQEFYLSMIFSFLKVSQNNYDYNFKKLHQIKYVSSIDEKSKLYLLNSYKADIEKVEELLGWDCNDWKI